MEMQKKQQKSDESKKQQSKFIWNPPVFRRLAMLETKTNPDTGTDGAMPPNSGDS